MFPNLLKSQLKQNQHRLYSNNLKLISESAETTVVNGVPRETVTETEHWSGKGSLQYVRPRIQKAIAGEYAGTMEDPISIVCYVPFEAEPNESMTLVDVDGVTGPPGSYLLQSRKPANVGGLSVYWELYLGRVSND